MVATRRSARVANATAAVSEKIGSVANASTSKAQKSPYSVFFFVPNLIGKITRVDGPSFDSH
jgi:hypothetical protein